MKELWIHNMEQSQNNYTEHKKPEKKRVHMVRLHVCKIQAKVTNIQSLSESRSGFAQGWWYQGNVAEKDHKGAVWGVIYLGLKDIFIVLITVMVSQAFIYQSLSYFTL